MADSSDTGASSLQAISTKALLQQLPIEEAKQSFASLPPLAQANLFSDLLSQHRELQQKQDGIQKSIARIPSADRHVAFIRQRFLTEGTDYTDHPCELAETFCEIWQIRDAPAEYDPARRGPVQVDRSGYDLFRLSQNEPFCWMSSRKQTKHVEQSGQSWGEYMQSSLFSSAISSQLLLYRLCATFGPLPTQCEGSDWYKSCWEIYLVYKKEIDAGVSTAGNDDQAVPASELRLCDIKASAYASFYGSEEAAEKALDLINYLVGPKCAHTYDGCVAGCQA
ncbi:uncharacterized protein AB675_3426 [Cyphellophora attinorum]|uniref:Uncharacterized protein n=1 Tax=Cyphellophora attinorum TaxID=1664694 RepID=A0A0N1H8Z1_9EURO|nr:uncharacterized protein AB675_3426 [Phialophora attinorum]KPI39805.1 hypothetical protein AB675_3426 [Phialophora attinorum]